AAAGGGRAPRGGARPGAEAAARRRGRAAPRLTPRRARPGAVRRAAAAARHPSHGRLERRSRISIMTVETAATKESGADRESRLAALAVLAGQVRELMDAVALTDVAEDELTRVTEELAVLTERLRAARRATPLQPELAPDGSFRHLGNAVAG